MSWMRNSNCASGKDRAPRRRVAATACLALLLGGCATPQYAIRPTPVPDESPAAVELERTISAYQARDLERHGAQSVPLGERRWGFDVQDTVNRLSRVTERPTLHYQVVLLSDREPNAVALADGRIYITAGMLNYLASRGSHPNELALIVSHELAHTVAQHLVKRYQQLQQQQILMAIVGLGTSIATQQAGVPSSVGSLVSDVASLVNNVVASGYSQAQELEADQLGVRYMLRAGYQPRAALPMLRDFSRFDVPWPFLRTHPYSQRRADDLERYLQETGTTASPPRSTPATIEAQRRWLHDAQQLYPVGSQSWNNLEQQLKALGDE